MAFVLSYYGQFLRVSFSGTGTHDYVQPIRVTMDPPAEYVGVGDFRY